jgi:LPPG:FO 2-phospho-L-lactate transferase
MTDTHTPTTILTKNGEMHFQEYLVKHQAQPKVTGIRFENIETAEPAPGVAKAILETDAVVICPSNPLISIGPILAVPGMRDLVKQTKAKVVVVSSVVDSASLKGPTDQMLRDLGMEVSALQIARLYEDIADIFVLDQRDQALRPEIETLGLQVVITDTVMRDADKKRALAETILTALSA